MTHGDTGPDAGGDPEKPKAANGDDGNEPASPDPVEGASAAVDAATLEQRQRLVDDAKTLLAFGSREGYSIAANITEQIVRSSHALETGKWDPELEGSLLSSLNTLAKLVSPVTVKSIEDTKNSFVSRTYKRMFWRGDKKKFSICVPVTYFRIWSVVALSLLLITQIYWVVGSTVTKDIRVFETKITEATREIVMIQSRAENKEGGGFTLSPQDAISLERLSFDLRTHRNAVASRYYVLTEWNSGWQGVLGVFLTAWDGLWSAVSWPFQQIFGEKEKSKIFSPRTEGRKTPLASAPQDQITFTTAQFTTEVISLYFLPLLYGLLGACVYVMRSLSEEIRNSYYTEESNVRYRSRLYLGALAGFAIAWFVTPENTPGIVASLSPFALAFVAGYSVELFFGAMDKVISAFLGKGGDNRRSAAAD